MMLLLKTLLLNLPKPFSALNLRNHSPASLVNLHLQQYRAFSVHNQLQLNPNQLSLLKVHLFSVKTSPNLKPSHFLVLNLLNHLYSVPNQPSNQPCSRMLHLKNQMYLVLIQYLATPRARHLVQSYHLPPQVLYSLMQVNLN